MEELRSELPPPVPKPNPESKKTHGRWVDAQGTVQPIVSGEDEHSEAAAEMFKQAGVPPSKKLAITAHAEVKVVVQMVQANQAHSEVVVNNRPCPGPLGCDALLPVILPDGSSLTVHGPNYRKTYTGGKKW
ncbi:SCP1.201-like deaminase [Amycolatopsis lurida]|nr:SCP1.201-like deaminase [Amycolatopsis lurida]